MDAATRKGLEDATGIHDPEQIQELQALGFTLADVPLLPLMPVLQVAWAEGGVSSRRTRHDHQPGARARDRRRLGRPTRSSRNGSIRSLRRPPSARRRG